MCSTHKDTVASNERWKKAGGKTKRGKPIGPREVSEKYKAIGFDILKDHNLKQLGIENRACGYASRSYLYVAAILDAIRSRANRLALQDQLSALKEYEEDVVQGNA